MCAAAYKMQRFLAKRACAAVNSSNLCCNSTCYMMSNKSTLERATISILVLTEKESLFLYAYIAYAHAHVQKKTRTNNFTALQRRQDQTVKTYSYMGNLQNRYMCVVYGVCSVCVVYSKHMQIISKRCIEGKIKL